MTEAPEKIWFTKVGKNIIPNSQRMSPEDVEYLRKDKHTAYLADYRAAYEGSCDQIDELRAEVERLQSALEAIIWEYDPSDPGGIAEAMFSIAFDAQTHKEINNES